MSIKPRSTYDLSDWTWLSDCISEIIVSLEKFKEEIKIEKNDRKLAYLSKFDSEKGYVKKSSLGI